MKDRKIHSKIDEKYAGGKKSFMGPKQNGRVKRVIIAGLFLLIAALLMAQHSFATTITFKAVLNGPAEAPPNTSPGTGNATAIIDTAAHTLYVSAAFSGLMGNTSAAHIHCCTATPFAGTAGVATQTPSFTGFPLGVTSGSFSNTFDLKLASSWNPAFITANGGTPESAEAALAAGLLAGRAYFNIHSTMFPAGEIRGFLTARFPGPTSSQPLAITADGAFLAVVNPDNDSVSFFDLRSDQNRFLAEVPVQSEPNGVAFLPGGDKAYVANTVSGTVSVIAVNTITGVISQASKHIIVGTEPYGLAVTPNGKKLYVSNSRSNSVSVIDTATDTVIKTITNAGFEPRGLAITNDGDDDDNDETLYVTQFLSLPVPGKVDGQDDAKQGFVTVISTSTDSVTVTVALNPIADTGFKALGDAINRIPPGDPSNPANFIYTTGAYPNQLNNIGLKGNFAFIPNTGASPNGPVRFDVNTQSLLSVINTDTNTDAGQTINMHTAVKNQTNPARLFITQPWAIAFKHNADQGYVLSAAGNIVVKLAINPATGLAAVQNNPVDSTKVLQIQVGKNPRGIVINPTDTRAYVMNYISRDVSVLNLASTPESVIATLKSSNLPTTGTLEDKLHIGKELYNTSVGVFDPAPGTTVPIVGRMSRGGWGSCSSCHPFGLSDNVVWLFASGPRRTIPQHTDFDQTDPVRSIQRALNWSANRDEEEDFELNIRGVSGGLGLIVSGDGVTQDPNVFNFLPLASGCRNQLKVRGIGAWDAIKTFIQFGIRAPISPISKSDPDVIAGNALFLAANCQSCHGAPQWTSSRINFTPPPAAGLVVNGQLIGQLRQVGTFDPTLLNEVRDNATAPQGADGFVPPSLLSIHAFPQSFFHGGSEASLDEVLQNVTHRSAGTGGVDTLSNPSDRQKLVKFLQSIDGETVPPVYPEIVNSLLSLAPLVTSYNPTPVTGAPAGRFTIKATFTNTGPDPVTKPFFNVVDLSGRNLLLNADGCPGGKGALLTPDVGADRVLSPGESFTVNFVIGLQTLARFTFFVDVLGVAE